MSKDGANQYFFYRGNDILKIWEQYLKASNPEQETGIRFYIDEGSSAIESIFNGMTQLQEKAIVLNGSDSSLYENAGKTLTLCGEVDCIHTDAINGVNKIQEAFEQVSLYNSTHAIKITNHLIIFPYHATPNHWNLGQIELAFDESGNLSEATIAIYEPLGGTATNRKDLVAEINGLGFLGAVRMIQQDINQPRQQYDGSSCGAITAENGKEFLKRAGDDDFLAKTYPKFARELRESHIIEIGQEAFTAAQRENIAHDAKGDKPLEHHDAVMKILSDCIARPENSWIKEVISRIKSTDNDNERRECLDLFRMFITQLDLSQSKDKISSFILNPDGGFKEGAMELLHALAIHPKELVLADEDEAKGSPAIYYDDTSDEDEEKANTKFSQKHKIEQQDIDLSWSCFMFDLGVRILRSPEVAEYYFPAKKKLGKVQNVPSDKRFKELFREVIKKLFSESSLSESKIDEVFVSEDYISREDSFLKSHMDILSRKADFIQGKLKEELSNILKLFCFDHITETVELLKSVPDFILQNGKVTTGEAKLKKATSFIGKSSSPIAPALLVRIASYRKEADSSGKKTPRDLADSLSSEALNEGIFEKFVKLFEQDLSNLKISRPTLSDSTVHFYEDFADPSISIEHKGPLLFAHLRIKNCSAKRTIKNSKQDEDFDGAVLSRSWSFKPASKEAIIEVEKISKNYVRTDFVVYPDKSNYAVLIEKLTFFQKKNSVSDNQVVQIMKSLLKDGRIPDDIKMSPAFEKFITTFTYHLFVTEVQRHPAALIHNIMALDLVTKDIIALADAINMLPMTVKALGVIRSLQLEFAKDSERPYFYDKDKENTAKFDSIEFITFISKEKELVRIFVDKFTSKQNQFNSVIKKLCEEYFGISITFIEKLDEHLSDDSDYDNQSTSEDDNGTSERDEVVSADDGSPLAGMLGDMTLNESGVNERSVLGAESENTSE